MDRIDHSENVSPSPYRLLFEAAAAVPTSHYFLALSIILVVFLYSYLEFHFFQDLRSVLWGAPIPLTHNSCSEIYDDVVSRCRLLHGRYLATPWLSSPHFQTAFLSFFGRPPVVNYRRQIFHASDGGTIALDWLMCSDVLGGGFHVDTAISKDDTTPLVVVIPGLTSDSASAYIKHLAFNVARQKWNVVISNHRGLGGISITSDCFYNAGWTKDAREVISYLHHEFPMAPLFAIGTSIGANVLIKYLGEDGENLPVAGAAAICCPWDLLIGDRFIKRRFLQKLYDKALASGLQGYAQLHQPHYSRLANWEGIKKSHSIRDFDMHATCLVGKFETVDTYYRRCSSANFVGNVSVPLLCINALDDPVCSKETIPWDECRANKNIVLATPQHGGHLGFFEGIAASSLWWVRAVIEFLSVLNASPFMHKQELPNCIPNSALESWIDRAPYVNLAADGMVAAMGTDPATDAVAAPDPPEEQDGGPGLNGEQDEVPGGSVSELETPEPRGRAISRWRDVICRQNRWSVWLLAYVVIVTSWPMVGSAVRFFYRRKKLRGGLPGG